MLNDDQRAATSREYRERDRDYALDPYQSQDQDDEHIREIHALTPAHPPVRPANCGCQRETTEISSHRSSSLSMGSSTTSSSENFTSMSREFNALVIAGSAIRNNNGINGDGTNLARIREENMAADHQETNPLAIVVDNSPLDPLPSLRPATTSTGRMREVSMQRAKKDEVDSKILAWQTAKISKINNRFKREDSIINVWESEQVQKATTCMKKVERKLEEKRARALEKMQNDVAKAQRKAKEKRASAEARRGTKVARLLEMANLMRAVGRPPAKRSFF